MSNIIIELLCYRIFYFVFCELTIAQAIGPHATAGEHVARALFSDKMPDDAIRRYMRRFQGESLLVTLDLLGLELPPYCRYSTCRYLSWAPRTTGSSFRFAGGGLHLPDEG